MQWREPLIFRIQSIQWKRVCSCIFVFMVLFLFCFVLFLFACLPFFFFVVVVVISFAFFFFSFFVVALFCFCVSITKKFGYGLSGGQQVLDDRWRQCQSVIRTWGNVSNYFLTGSPLQLFQVFIVNVLQLYLNGEDSSQQSREIISFPLGNPSLIHI